MTVFMKAIIGIVAAVAGGLIGMWLLMYVTVALLALFAAVSLNKAFFSQLSFQFQEITSKPNAQIISFAILTVLPIVSIAYVGRFIITRLNMDQDTLTPPLNSVLGSGYAVALYLVVLYIIGK